MSSLPEQALTLALDGSTETVSALLSGVAGARAGYVFAHGAGAGMRHRFMQELAAALAERKVACLRYQFVYMQKGLKRPDPPALAHAVVRAAVVAAAEQLPGLPLFAGGKSFGGRMTSQAHAAAALPHVVGLAFVGFPLHPAGQPATERAEHLSQAPGPLLFLQGTRDELADLGLLSTVVHKLGPRATLRAFEDADHSFHVRAKSGLTDAETLQQLAGALADWMTACIDGGATVPGSRVA